MSPNKSLLTVGLTALGLLGYAASCAADPGVSPAPPGQPSAPASTPTHTVLLKTNGDLLTGPITVEGDHYIVHKSGGPIPVPKRLVENTFESLADVYRYRLERAPERDPDEQLKLARWCLNQSLPAEAKTALKAVLACSPNAREAKAMLGSIEAREARLEQPRVDTALIQTGGARPASNEANSGSNGDGRPAEIDAAAIRRAQHDLGVSSAPVIFDLPPALAVKRADTFARNVHPILIMACAKCHNDQYPGTFQLVDTKARRGPTPSAYRANLDAALRLIDADNPTRSALLSRSLVPHGKGQNQRPIFNGANDVRYQIIDAWVKSLRVSRSPDGVTPARFAPDATQSGDGFAVDRVPGQTSVVAPSTGGNAPRSFVMPPPEAIPPSRYVPGQGMMPEQNPPGPGEFPLPPTMGGPMPKVNNGSPAPTQPTPPPTASLPAGPGPQLPPLPSTTAPPTPDGAPAAKPKPVKIDADVLQRALLNRNLGR